MKILKGFNGNTGEPILVQKKNRITLRMLLSHTGKHYLIEALARADQFVYLAILC
jgi:hypothetical protein